MGDVGPSPLGCLYSVWEETRVQLPADNCEPERGVVISTHGGRHLDYQEHEDPVLCSGCKG